MFTTIVIVLISLGYIYGFTPAKNYVVEGKLLLPYLKLIEIINTTYCGDKGLEKIDYYNGLSTYYYSIKENRMDYFGPVQYVKKCFRAGLEEDSLTPMFPDLTLFTKLNKTAIVMGKECYDYYYEVKLYETEHTYHFYVEVSSDLPVRLYMIGRNLVFGSHYDEYVLEYDKYTPKDTISDDEFKVPASYVCGEFPGPGNSYFKKPLMIFNKIFSKIFKNNNINNNENNNHHIKHHKHHDHHHKHHNKGENKGKNDDNKLENKYENTYINKLKNIFGENKLNKYMNKFGKFINKYNKKYNNEEYPIKLNNYINNLIYINKINRKNLSYKLEMNSMGDLNKEEMFLRMGKLTNDKTNENTHIYKKKSEYVRPSEIDWRTKGAVTPVKDQAHCGSCWTYGVAGTVEGTYYRLTGKPVNVSTQHIMDCTWDQGNNGCMGGEDFRAYNWILKNKGFMSEAEYGPYRGQHDYCHHNTKKPFANLDYYVNVEPYNPNALLDALAEVGPISVSVHVIESFVFYKSGVYYDEKCTGKLEEMNHIVLAVGYGSTKEGEDYYIIKNSWSTHWGEDGYMRLSRKGDACGIDSCATYVTLKDY